MRREGAPRSGIAPKTSRGELVAKLFAEHYSDPFHDTLVHID